MYQPSPIAILFMRGFVPSDLDEKDYKKF